MKSRRPGSGFGQDRPRWRIALAALGLVFVLAMIVFEAASLGWIYLVRGQLYYRAREAAPGTVPAAVAVPDAVFHPYMGFVHRVGRKGEGWTTNNMGFQVADSLPADCCDYPMARRAGEVLVGVLGGSVAVDFALQAQRTRMLEQRLGAIPAYAGRTVRVLNFAMPGFRQPQQLATLAWFRALGHGFDVVLAIDGFNEAVTSYRNFQSGVEPAFPADTLWGEWGRQLELAAGRGAGDPGDRALSVYYAARAAKWRNEAEQCTLAACHLTKRVLARLAHWRSERLAREAKEAPAPAGLFPTALRSRFDAPFDVFAYAADRWRDSARAMDALARAHGALFLQVLQPNQWWRDAGDYRPIASDHIYGWVAEPVNRGYPALVARLAELRAAGVETLDATMLFKDVASRAAYADDCCHYTAQANELLAGAIADAIAAAHAEGRGPQR